MIDAITDAIPAMSASSDAARSAAAESLRETTNQVVGEVFYGTLLKQMRSATLGGKYGHGGRGEDAFAPQLDQLFAQRAGSARDSEITRAVLKRYQRQADVAAVYRQNQRDALAAAQQEIRTATVPVTGDSSW